MDQLAGLLGEKASPRYSDPSSQIGSLKERLDRATERIEVVLNTCTSLSLHGINVPMVVANKVGFFFVSEIRN